MYDLLVLYDEVFDGYMQERTSVTNIIYKWYIKIRQKNSSHCVFLLP